MRLVDLTTDMVAEHMATLAALPSKCHQDARANGIAPNAAIVLRSCIVKACAGGTTRPLADTNSGYRRRRLSRRRGGMKGVAAVVAVAVLLLGTPLALAVVAASVAAPAMDELHRATTCLLYTSPSPRD